MNYTKEYPERCIKCGKSIRPKAGTTAGDGWCKCSDALVSGEEQ